MLPGPALPELARTALARAAAATVSDASPVRTTAVAGQVPVRAGRDGSPVLLPASQSPLARWLASGPAAVMVSVPAGTPFSALRLTGTVHPVGEDHGAGITACALSLRAVELAGPRGARIPVEQFRAAEPDPLWRVAASVLRHLEHGHMAELVGCVRAHGLTEADWVMPRGLDRFGLRLLVLTTSGAGEARLSFPGGPITSLDDLPASIRAALTCRCPAAPQGAGPSCPMGQAGFRAAGPGPQPGQAPEAG